MKINWRRVSAILFLGAGLIYLSVLLGKSPIGYAFGGEATLTWTAPTKNCDGTALTNLKHYELIYGQTKEILPLTALSKTITGLRPGTHWFSVAAVNASDVRSEFVTVSKTIQASEFVTTGADVYTFVKATDRVVLLKVGTVPLGVVCDATVSVNGKHGVPIARVTWSGSTRPVVVVGDCG